MHRPTYVAFETYTRSSALEYSSECSHQNATRLCRCREIEASVAASCSLVPVVYCVFLNNGNDIKNMVKLEDEACWILRRSLGQNWLGRSLVGP